MLPACQSAFDLGPGVVSLASQFIIALAAAFTAYQARIVATTVTQKIAPALANGNKVAPDLPPIANL